MPQFVVMNQAQANTIRGQTVLGHACAPIPVGGTNPLTLALPIAIKTDPAHQSLWASLAPFTVVTTTSITPHNDTVLVKACTFDEPTWTVGKKIVV
jgi:hypothetical protein